MKKIFLGLLVLCFMASGQAQTFPVNNLTVNGLAQFNNAANFTLSPTAPTPSPGDSSTKAATTAFVTAGFIPLSTLSGLAPLASPVFTGTPFAPTAARGTNSQQIATTAFVVNRDTAQCARIIDYGGDPTGVSNNAVAFNAAVTASFAASGGFSACVEFGVGTFLFSTAVSVTIPTSPGELTIIGAGPQSTYWKSTINSGAALTINYRDAQSSAHVRSMAFTTTQNGLSQAIKLNMLATCGGGGCAQLPTSDFSHLIFHGADGWNLTNYWNTGIYNAGVSGLTFYDDTFYGPTGTPSGYGIFLDWAADHSIIPVVFNIIGCQFTHLNAGTLYGGNTQGVTVVASNYTANSYGIQIPSTASAVDQLSITGSQFNNITASVNTDSPLQALTMSNNFFLVSNNSSAVRLFGTAQFSITGNVFAPAVLPATNQTGISILSWNQGSGVITGNQFDVLTIGINFGAGAGRVNVQSNSYAPTIGAQIGNAGNCPTCTFGGGSL